jgi:uncharacterized RDD family membrane protein YckC
MPCPLCGDICRCSNDADSPVTPRWLADDDPFPPAAVSPGEPEAPQPEIPLASEASLLQVGAEPAPEDSPEWRNEVAARLNRYQARRKPRPPRYPSLQLRFEEENSTRAAAGEQAQTPTFPHSVGTTSYQALALDSFAESAPPHVEPPVSEARPQQKTASLRADESSQPPAPIPSPASAKIIEFPRSWTPPAAPLDELAEPVTDRPRILEAPEFLPPAPALGGITIEPAPHPELEKRPGIDIPLQSAPLARRILSAALDGVIIAVACALFGFIFWKMTAIQFSRFQMVALLSPLFGVLWAAYQYLLLVYSGSTPGLRLAKLQLARFNGSRASRRLRRWRVLASFLSALSLGMGYAWVFLDEDALCWHDRITHTYLAPVSPE